MVLSLFDSLVVPLSLLLSPLLSFLLSDFDDPLSLDPSDFAAGFDDE